MISILKVAMLILFISLSTVIAENIFLDDFSNDATSSNYLKGANGSASITNGQLEISCLGGLVTQLLLKMPVPFYQGGSVSVDIDSRSTFESQMLYICGTNDLLVASTNYFCVGRGTGGYSISDPVGDAGFPRFSAPDTPSTLLVERLDSTRFKASYISSGVTNQFKIYTNALFSNLSKVYLMPATQRDTGSSTKRFDNLRADSPNYSRYVSLTGTHQPPFTNWVTAATNIQAAVNVSLYGDVIGVDDGRYVLTNQISITNGVTIIGASGTRGAIIDGGYPVTTNRCFYLSHSNAVLDGLTITNGYIITDSSANGGGIYIDGNGVVQNCTITKNTSDSADINGSGHGGGTYINGGGMISNCLFLANSSIGWGRGGGAFMAGGAILDSSFISNNVCGLGMNNGLVANCLFTANIGSSYDGGGLTMWGGTAKNCSVYRNTSGLGGGMILATGPLSVENCTVVSNNCSGSGGGIYAYDNSTNLVIRNTILKDNFKGAGTPSNYEGLETNVSYSCSTPLLPGVGNIASDPLFLSLSSNNFRLATNSPCVDVGTNLSWMTGATDLGGTNRIIGGKVDMGAYETTLDSDSDGIPDWWMNQYFGHPTGLSGDKSRATDDYDSDRFTTLEEYQNGSLPQTFTYGRSLPFNADRYVSTNGNHQYPYTNWFTASTNIQTAITAAGFGDTVWVTNGTYTGTNNISLDFGGIDLTLKSVSGAENTIIDVAGASENCGLIFHSGESSNAVVDGFTIKNGSMTLRSWGGGGIYVDNAAPTIRNCIFDSNWCHRYGGAICVVAPASAFIKNCIFTRNTSGWGGAAVSGSATIIGCLFFNHSGDDTTLYFSSGSTSLVHSCTIVSNSLSRSSGGGILCELGSSVRIANTIAYANSIPGGAQLDVTGDVQVAYSCIQGGFTGTGNINTNPLFASGYRLSSASPCLDKGTNLSWMVGATDLDGNTRIGNGTVDMGAYELGFYIGMRFSAIDVTWNSASGVTYQVQSCTNLISPSWTNVSSSVTATGTSSYVPDWIRDNRQKFYRVVIP